MKRVAAALIALGSVAHADTVDEPKPSPPDPVAETAATEANLMSNARHDAFTVTGSLGGGLLFGDGVGRGAAGSFRIGFRHRDVMETLEISVGSLLHETTGSNTLLHNDDVSAMGGVQYYTTPSLWIRGAAGLTVYSVETQTMAGDPIVSHDHKGAGGLLSVGLDVVRLRHFVLDVETFAVLSVVGVKGLLVTSGLCVGASFY